MRYVNFWDQCMNPNEPTFAGRVILDDDGTLRAEPGLVPEVTPESLLAEEVPVRRPDGRLRGITRDVDPVAWFEGLPTAFKGSYFWASKVQEGTPPV